MHSRSLLDQVRLLWRHAAWSDVTVLEALRTAKTVPDEALKEYAHLVAAEEVWLSRIERRPARSPVWPTLTLDQAETLGEQVRRGFEQYLDSLDAEDLVEEVRYVTSSGSQMVNVLADILMHVALHGQYHRGRVNMLLRHAGGEPSATDYIAYARGVPLPTPFVRHGGVVTLLLPGLYDSGPEHWQSRWERLDATCRRVRQSDWATPRCADWVSTLDGAIAEAKAPVILVAHSSAAALVAHWARQASAERIAQVRGALLVAPSDPESSSYPQGPTGFAPVPMERLPFPSVVVASSNDEYVSLDTARAFADAWGSHFVDVGAKGHINATSGLGDWPEGYLLLGRLRSAAARHG